MAQKDISQTFLLLNEMNVSAQHVALLVDNMIQKVRNGELITDQGLSFLEVKYTMLLTYLINLSYVVLRKCSGNKIENHPCIDRLIEIRTILEKIRPIERKLKYQIDKLVRSAVSGGNHNDPATFKANPSNLRSTNESHNNDEIDTKENKSSKPDIYVPPKISAVYYSGSESAVEKNRRLQGKHKKMELSSSMLEDLRNELLDTPIEVTQGSKAQQILSKEQRKKEEYEEEYMTRLPISKKDKHRQRQFTTIGVLGDEITNFKVGQSGNQKRKRNSFKSKAVGNKKKRY